MSYMVVACSECRVLLFDPDLKDSGPSRDDWQVVCPICKKVTDAIPVHDLSDR